MSTIDIGNILAITYQGTCNGNDDQVRCRERDFFQRGQVPALVHIQPQDGREAEGEPAGE